MRKYLIPADEFPRETDVDENSAPYYLKNKDCFVSTLGPKLEVVDHTGRSVSLRRVGGTYLWIEDADFKPLFKKELEKGKSVHQYTHSVRIGDYSMDAAFYDNKIQVCIKQHSLSGECILYTNYIDETNKCDALADIEDFKEHVTRGAVDEFIQELKDIYE